MESSASLEYIAGSDVYLQNMEDVPEVPATATLKAFECSGGRQKNRFIDEIPIIFISFSIVQREDSFNVSMLLQRQ